MAPHAITNSWVCDLGEGCRDPNVLLQVVENVRAAGIVVVAGAGNDGPDCSTVFYPPAIYAQAFCYLIGSEKWVFFGLAGLRLDQSGQEHRFRSLQFAHGGGNL